MWITVRRCAAWQRDFEQPNRFIYFAEFKKIGFFYVKKSRIKADWEKCTAFFMKTAEFLQKFIENRRIFRENPKIRRLPNTVIPQAVEHTFLLIHNMLTTCANC